MLTGVVLVNFGCPVVKRILAGTVVVGGWLVLVAWIKMAERKPFVYLKAAVRGELEENAGAEGSDTGSVNQTIIFGFFQFAVIKLQSNFILLFRLK